MQTIKASTVRRKRNERANKRLRAKQAKISGRKPVRDKQYLAWIRTLDCVLSERMVGSLTGLPAPCRHWFRTEAAHVGPNRGICQKCSDYEVIPLCSGHHRLSADSHHRLGKKFWKHHNLDREAIIKALRARYELLKKGAAA